MKHTLELGLTDHLIDISERLSILAPLIIARDDVAAVQIDCVSDEMAAREQILELVIRQLSDIVLDLRRSADSFMEDVKARDDTETAEML